MSKSITFIPLEERIVLDAALGAVIYVDTNATGDNNGTSWANAYKDLQSALSDAMTAGPDQIWVADGVYKPGAARLATYVIPDQTSLFGGFGGETILSGDIGVIGLNTDNIKQIVTVDALNSTVLMDGFTVAHGFNDDFANVVTAQGSGIVVSNGSDLSLNNMVLDDNHTSRSGGAVSVGGVGSAVAINSSTFTNNFGFISGGAIFANFQVTEVSISHSLFDSNISSGTQSSIGGAIRNDAALFSMDHTTLINNQSISASPLGIAVGGALGFIAQGTPMVATIDFCRFENNSAIATNVSPPAAAGGAVFMQAFNTSFNISFSHTDFIDNSSSLRGGAVQALGSQAAGAAASSLSFDHAKFEGNSAEVGGGAIALSKRGAPVADFAIGSVTIDHSSFTRNTAQLGGAILDSATLSHLITNSHFTENVATVKGGAIYTSDIGTISLAPLETNRVVTINSSHFDKNSSGTGGAIAFEDPGAQNVTLNLDNNHLNNNSANLAGAYYQSGGISSVHDNFFNKNYDANKVQAVVDLPSTVNGQTTSGNIISALANDNKLLDDDEIVVII